MADDQEPDAALPAPVIPGQLSLFGETLPPEPDPVPALLVVGRPPAGEPRLLGTVILDPPERIYVPPAAGNAGHILNNGPAFRRLVVFVWGSLVLVALLLAGLVYVAYACGLTLTVTVPGAAAGAAVTAGAGIAAVLGLRRRRGDPPDGS